jgi:hypothetical protein
VDFIRVEHTFILAYCEQELPSNVAAALLPLRTALLAYARRHVFVFQMYAMLWHPSCIWCLQSAGCLPRFRHSKERCLRLDPGRCNVSMYAVGTVCQGGTVLCFIGWLLSSFAYCGESAMTGCQYRVYSAQSDVLAALCGMD